MSSVRSSLLTLLLILGCVHAASAQSPSSSPYDALYSEGSITAVGVWISGVVPIEPVLRNGAQGALSLEAYTSPRVSFRAEAGYGRSGVDREFRYEVRHLFAEVDALYHWEHGATRATRSYVGIGAGVYRYASIIPGSVANDPALRKQMIALGLDPDTMAGTHEKEFEVGANGIFGVEYLMSKSASVSLEGGYHRVGRVFAVHPYDGAFLAASLGAKFYF